MPLGEPNLTAIAGFLLFVSATLLITYWALRNLGRYTFTDVVAMRLRQKPVRIAAATGSLAVVSFYLIAQMVGAGNLVRLLFGIDYSTAVVIVGVVMLAYVIFGGMIATTWVQIDRSARARGWPAAVRRSEAAPL